MKFIGGIFISPIFMETNNDHAESGFDDWFNELIGFSFTCEYFWDACEIIDEKQRKNVLKHWIHGAYLAGYQQAQKLGECQSENCPPNPPIDDSDGV